MRASVLSLVVLFGFCPVTLGACKSETKGNKPTASAMKAKANPVYAASKAKVATTARPGRPATFTDFGEYEGPSAHLPPFQSIELMGGGPEAQLRSKKDSYWISIVACNNGNETIVSGTAFKLVLDPALAIRGGYVEGFSTPAAVNDAAAWTKIATEGFTMYSQRPGSKQSMFFEIALASSAKPNSVEQLHLQLWLKGPTDSEFYPSSVAGFWYR